MKGIVILVVAFDGYQQIEYQETKKVVEQAGFVVKTASSKKGAAVAKDGSTCVVDITLEQINMNDCLGVFFIGGPGVLEDLNSLKTHHLIQKIADSGKPFGAICLATRILAQAGVLAKRKATGWDGDCKLKEIYDSYQVQYEKKAVVIDGKLITATGPDSATEFGKAIVDLVTR